MQTATVSFTQAGQVQDFVDLVNRYPFDVDIVSGRNTVDAKSILGIYNLDLRKPVQLLIYNDDCAELLNALEVFGKK